jgi:tyrosinase
MVSPADPIFWLHHAEVDRQWSIWQARAANAGKNPSLTGANQIMDPWPETEQQVRSIATLGYSYDGESNDNNDVVVLIVDAPARQAAIDRAGEVDSYQFEVAAAGTYTIVTEGSADLVMSLFGPNSRTALITEADDDGQNRNPRIVSRLTAGTYYAQVRHYQANATGNYRISVRGEAETGIPEIQVNGPLVQGAIAAANESDIYTFNAGVAALYTIETTGNTDTFLTLFGPDNQTRLVAQDDDSGPEANSRIIANLMAGVYFVRVRHYSPTGTGAYRLAVTRR